jgi:hypothetical protein
VFFNRRRRHSTLGFLSPEQYEITRQTEDEKIELTAIVAAQKPRVHRTGGTPWGLSSVDVQALIEQVAPPNAQAPASTERDVANGAELFPRVPRVDYPLFLAEAFERLPAEAFRLVLEVFDDAYNAAADWIEAGGLDFADADGGELSNQQEQATAAWLRKHVAGCATADEAISRLRGAQAAFFWRTSASRLTR